MARRYWTCKCKIRHPGIAQKCATCGQRRPPRRRPKHQTVLEHPYEMWVACFGNRCNICGRPPGPRRKLDRDHDHRTGLPRGCLCHRCNRLLAPWVTPEWLIAAAAYLNRETVSMEPTDLF